MSLSEKGKMEVGRGGFHSFLVVSQRVALSKLREGERERGRERERERERGKERGICNCCQSLLSTALKAAAVSQLRSERSLGCVASPMGLWRIWWVLSPFLFTSHCQQRHADFWVQGNQRAKSLSRSETEAQVIEMIILNMPAMIWRVFRWWKFSPPKDCTQISKQQKASPKTSMHGFWHVGVYSRRLVNHFGRYIFIQAPLLCRKAASNLTDCNVILCAFRAHAPHTRS